MKRDEISDFERVFEEYADRHSDFYITTCQLMRNIAEVQEQSDGHGCTFVVKSSEGCSAIDDYLQEATPYNGETRNVFDDGIASIMVKKREEDQATVISSEGIFLGKNVGLPMDTVDFKKRYGIETRLAEYLGYAPGETGPGARNLSALYASDIMPDVCIITLGENEHGQPKGAINVYYQGRRIYSQEGRQMNMARATIPPPEPAYFTEKKPLEAILRVA